MQIGIPGKPSQLIAKRCPRVKTVLGLGHFRLFWWVLVSCPARIGHLEILRVSTCDPSYRKRHGLTRHVILPCSPLCFLSPLVSNTHRAESPGEDTSMDPAMPLATCLSMILSVAFSKSTVVSHLSSSISPASFHAPIERKQYSPSIITILCHGHILVPLGSGSLTAWSNEGAMTGSTVESECDREGARGTRRAFTNPRYPSGSNVQCAPRLSFANWGSGKAASCARVRCHPSSPTTIASVRSADSTLNPRIALAWSTMSLARVDFPEAGMPAIPIMRRVWGDALGLD